MLDPLEIECLRGFITPRISSSDGSYPKPKSRLFVDDLPGFSSASLSAVEPGKYLDAQRFIDEKMRFAGTIIYDRIRTELQRYVQEGDAKEAGTFGTFDSDADQVPLPGSADPRGVWVTAGGGPMMVPVVSRVWVRCVNDVPGAVLKATDGKTESEQTVDLKGGGVENEVWVNFEGTGKTVTVTIEDDRFLPYVGKATGTTYFAGCTTCSTMGMYRYMTGGGVMGNDHSNTLTGMRAEAVVVCSLMPVICILFQRFRLPLLYQWGILVLEEWIATPRTNYFTIHSKDWAIASLEKWSTVDLNRVLKPQILSLASFVKQLDPQCLKCGIGYGYENVHP